MVLKNKITWLSRDEREQQPATSGNGSRSVYFGLQRIPAAEKADRVRQHFDSVARYYDVMNTLLSFGIHHLWKRTAIQMLQPVAGDHVLDVCGGTGDLAILAAKKIGDSGQVVVYDINRLMLQAGLRKVINRSIEQRMCYVQGDAEKISFPDNRFDGVMVAFGIRNVTHMEKGFREMMRVLKPGGKMICLEFSRPTQPLFRWLYDVYSFKIMPLIGEQVAGSRKAYTHLPESIRSFPLPDELSRILQRIGFSNVAYRRLTNGIAVIHQAEKAQEH